MKKYLMSSPKNERLSFFSCLPQAGQDNTESITSFWHSGHLINAI
ncbi:hypothetical protein AB67_2652 [Escherichia coli 5-366-08_S1_C3]|nr:hypothetical protein AB67_2652 [Escherichia coli 5-366-08_S1_C3]